MEPFYSSTHLIEVESALEPPLRREGTKQGGVEGKDKLKTGTRPEFQFKYAQSSGMASVIRRGQSVRP
jgi:hypothetical protein